MIRYYCDKCGKEASSDQKFGVRVDAGVGKSLNVLLVASDRAVGVTYGTLGARSLDQTYGHFCIYCVIDAVNTLDDRPKVAPKSKR